MSRQPLAMVLQRFRRLSHSQAGDDGLLEQFLTRQDGDAFATVVERHGPLVLRVCRRILHREQDVEDAFQATFLILVRKSRTVYRRQSLAGWLYTVAQRVAWSARASIARRQRVERPVADLRWAEEQTTSADRCEGDAAQQAERSELNAVVEQELGRLPEKYRIALILCDLQGRTHAEAARELSLPQGSVSRHLERGRDLLRRRLAHRGVGVGAVALAALLVDSAVAAVPAALIQATAAAAGAWASGSALSAGLVSARVVTLAQGVLQAMWFQKCKMIVLGLVACALLIGAAILGFSSAGADPVPQLPAAGDKQPPVQKPALPAAPVLYFSTTEKPNNPQGMGLYVNVKDDGMFFGADGDTLYIQRAGANGGLGVGAPGAGGLQNIMQESLESWSMHGKKKLGHLPNVQAAALSPDGNLLGSIILVNNKQVVRLAKAKSGEIVREMDLTKIVGVLPQIPNLFGGPGMFQPTFMGTLTFTHDGKFLSILSLQTNIDLGFWEVQTGQTARVQAPFVLSLAGYLPDGKSAAGVGTPELFGGGNGVGKVFVWNPATGKILRAFGDHSLNRAILAPKSNTLAAFGNTVNGNPLGGNPLGGNPFGAPPVKKTAQIQLWDAATGKLKVTCDTKIMADEGRVKVDNGILTGPGGIMDVAFTSDGKVMASCLTSGDVGHVHLWEVATGKELAHLKLTFGPQAIAFSRDGTFLATAGGLGPFELRVWNVASLTGAGSKNPAGGQNAVPKAP